MSTEQEIWGTNRVADGVQGVGKGEKGLPHTIALLVLALANKVGCDILHLQGAV